MLSFLRGLLEVLQLDFLPRGASEAAESQLISWQLELPGNITDVGVMRIYTSQKDYVGLAPLAMVRHAACSEVREGTGSGVQEGAGGPHPLPECRAELSDHGGLEGRQAAQRVLRITVS